MNDQPDDRVWGLTRWGGILTERDMRRTARLPRAEHRYDHGLPARDDIEQSLYREFAAGDQATERLIQLARDKEAAEAEPSRKANQAKAEPPDMKAEAEPPHGSRSGLMSDEGELAEEKTHNAGELPLPGARGDVDATLYERSAEHDQAEPAPKLDRESTATGQDVFGRPLRPEREAEPG